MVDNFENEQNQICFERLKKNERNGSFMKMNERNEKSRTCPTLFGIKESQKTKGLKFSRKYY